MKLEYYPDTRYYALHVPNDGRDIKKLMIDYGLDLSSSATTAREAVLFTPCAYAAAPFYQHAQPSALADDQLSWIMREVRNSYKTVGTGHYETPDDLELWPFQVADLDYMLARAPSGVMDADQPGLGKTPTAIVYSNEIRAKKVLIVCPANIRFQWLARWEEWSTMPRRVAKPYGYAIVSSKRAFMHNANVTVVSYDLIRRPGIHRALMGQQFDLLILDEAHNLKTQSAERTKAIFGGQFTNTGEETEGLASRAAHVIALTGTPLPNRPQEAYVYAINMCPLAIDNMSERKFIRTFNPVELREVDVEDENGYWQTKVYQHEESGRHAELQCRLRANFVTRHLKREVMTWLKLPAYDIVQGQKTPEVKQALAHEAALSQMVAEKLGLEASSLLELDPTVLMGAHSEFIGHISVVRREMGVALAPQVATYAKMLLDGGVEKLVVFYWHIEVGNILAAILGPYGVCRIDGSSSAVVREAQKKRFINDPKFRVLLGNQLSLGTGTDELQKVCSHCVLGEPDWVPGNNQQCVDRLDRGGQARAVNADFFVAPGSIVERVLASALRKAKVTHNTLDRRVG